jgi:alpha-ketoglutarate-dependent taurine dioxygenase
MKNLPLKKSGLKQQIGSLRRQVITLPAEELIQSGYLQPEETMPLVIRPGTDAMDLIDWLEGNHEFIENQLLIHGAILFRGFNINTASAFEELSLVICRELFNENGEHPRKNVSGNVYTPVFYPTNRQLLWHNENSFNHCWPRKILFGCRQPAQQGGETPIVDSRKVFQLLESTIREQFINKKVMYVRNYGDGLGLNWETVFQTKNPSDVEASCQQSGINFEWKSGNRLRTYAIRPAVVKHPQTGEMSWFNQAQHWHPACLDSETRESLLSMFPEEDLPRNCYYGDGTPIEDSVMAEICRLYQQLEVSFSWQCGDVLVLDNILTAHGRNPFVGERELFVALGEMASFAEISQICRGTKNV